METQITTLESIMNDFTALKAKQTIFSLEKENKKLTVELEGIGDHHIMCKADDGKLYYICTPSHILNVRGNVAFDTDKLPIFGNLNVQRCKTEQPESLTITPISNHEIKENVPNLFTIISQTATEQELEQEPSETTIEEIIIEEN
jgi:hypothetical protein